MLTPLERAGLGVAAALVLFFVACGRQEAVSPSDRGGGLGGGPPSASASGAAVASPPPGAGRPSDAPELPSTAHVPKDLPIGVSPILYAISVPPGRVPSPAQIALGDKLFNDKRLSADDSTSCATCHDPKAGFVDHKPVAVGLRNQKGQRNSPTVLNAMFAASQFWDGRAPTLEAQAKLPFTNPVEMGMKDEAALMAKVRAIPEYAAAFRKVFGREASIDDLATAIAAFERTQYAGDAPFDRYINGDESAIGASAKRGWAVFNGRGRCNSCHAGNAQSPLFSDMKFHNIGIAAHKQDFAVLAREAVAVVDSGDQKRVDELAIGTKFSELGRFLVSKQLNDIGAFKTMTLRNIALTAPYMHDGSLATLWDVMDHYNKGGEQNPHLDGAMQRLGLSEAEIDDTVEWMATLTSDKFAAFGKTEMARMRAMKNKRPERDVAAAMGKKGDLGDLAPAPDPKGKNPANVGVFGTYDHAAPGGH